MNNLPLTLALIAVATVIGVASYNQSSGGASAIPKTVHTKIQDRILPEVSARDFRFEG